MLGLSDTMPGIDQQQCDIGALDLAPGTGNANLLDFVLCFTQARGVDHVQRNALDLMLLLSASRVVPPPASRWRDRPRPDD